MILTTCWVCAAPLDQNWLGKCVRCDTRYCSQACLRQHPDEECRSITRGGGAEQYHADKKYKEAVVVAVEACAEDTATLDDLRDTASHLGDVATSTSPSRSCS